MAQTSLYSQIPPSSHGYLAARLTDDRHNTVLHIAVNDRKMQEAASLARTLAPDRNVLTFPAWDCLPYDRVSPAPSLVAERLATLAVLCHASAPLLVCTTISAAMQKLPPRAILAEASFTITKGETLQHDALVHYLAHHGYSRVSKVMEPGEFAVRGNIIDLFPAGYEQAVRIDLFGDEIESLKYFDPLSQISHSTADGITLHPMNEVLLNEHTIARFRSRYRDYAGAVTREDPLYEAISSGRHFTGMEHWLPLFYEQCDTLFDYIPATILSIDQETEQVYRDRLEMLQDYYTARIEAPAEMSGTPYHAIEPHHLYMLEEEWQQRITSHEIHYYTRLNDPGGIVAHGLAAAPSLRGKQSETLESAFSKLASRIETQEKPTLLACYSAGSQERLAQMLNNTGISSKPLAHLSESASLPDSHVGLCQLALEQGFLCEDFLLLTEQDLLGERIIRTEKRKRQSEAFLADAATLGAGELIVHKEHGIGRFEDLITLEVNGARHDCLKLVYADNAKLFLPVVNMELISRFGSDGEGVQLDKLGAVNWQKRKAAMKKRIRLAAEQLLKIAARRATRQAPELVPDPASYAAFCARFPFNETEDQRRAIDEVLSDIAAGRPMDRLICGDVGFGKTEVALRAAFVAASGAEKVQVALIAPTTLLARQHYLNFKERFKDTGITIRPLSRLVSAKAQGETKAGLKDGTVDIVIGAHALLSKQVEFKNLGMVIFDEEQRFGVAQKERLKQLRANIHVLTLTATPIPRTLQMSLAGVRELSLITTPPVDRLAVRSFVMPFDGITIKEAMLREFHRGGKSFVVTPRIEYLEELEKTIRTLVPDLRLCTAHGQMPASTLEERMQDFYDGKYDVLISTAIVESGLDVPSANTIIIDHAEMFGLAQLYQLRGRVGRGKTRAYAYLTLPARKKLTDTAMKRLEVMSQLDTLGAGFTLASHDMDIRGFGNLLGEEQSGHVREVGVELYQHMLEETIEQLKNGDMDADTLTSSDDWSPTINLGSTMLIPESYVDALDIRMQLYRRLANLETKEEIESFAAELIDRFGPLPKEVQQLIKTLHIKRLCKASGIERIDTGPKGAVISFRENAFKKPDALLRYITQHPKAYKIRADQKLVYMGSWRNADQQITQVSEAVATIAELAA